MKTIFLTLIVQLITVLCVSAQGTFQFNIRLDGASMVPPNSSTLVGNGSLTLQGTQLSYDFGGELVSGGGFPDTAEIRDPGLPGENAGFLFGLGKAIIAGPLPPETAGGFVYWGSITIQQSQVADLLAGRWYVLVTTQENPLGEIRGQIVPVPESSTFALLFGGAAGLVCFWRGRSSPKS